MFKKSNKLSQLKSAALGKYRNLQLFLKCQTDLFLVLSEEICLREPSHLVFPNTRKKNTFDSVSIYRLKHKR